MKLLFALSLLFYVRLNAQEFFYYNGNIFTANPKRPFVNAIAIRDGKIIAVGNKQQVKKAVGHAVIGIDLKGKTILPGLIDSHIHAMTGGKSLLAFNLSGRNMDLSFLQSYVAGIVQKRGSPSDGLIDVLGINITIWQNLDSLNAIFNRGAYAHLPLFLRGSDGHSAWANRALLSKAGIDKRYLDSIPVSMSQYFKRLTNGEPSGFVAEDGIYQFWRATAGQENWPMAADTAMSLLNSFGVTAWMDPSAGSSFSDSGKQLDAYAYLYSNHKLHAHVVATIVSNPDSNASKQFKVINALQAKYHNRNFAIKGCKIIFDGVLEYPAQTAAISRPYLGKADSGVLMFDPGNFARFVKAADSAGFMVHVHAIGDRAVHDALNGFEYMRHLNGQANRIHAITHMQLIRPGDFARFKELNIICALQLLWAAGDETTVDMVKPYVDSALYRWQYPAFSLLKAGAQISGASDWPVSSPNPFEAMATAETRRGDRGVLDSTQCMPRLDMLYAYTREAAKLMWADREIGSLEPGKYADMILVDRNVMSCSPKDLSATKVLWTMFEGRIVYSKSNPGK